MRECYVCQKVGNMHKHHIINGHGKRKACETSESLVDICYDCHRLIHSENGFHLGMSLKMDLQKIYFKKGYAEDEVRRLMGGKLWFDNLLTKSSQDG